MFPHSSLGTAHACALDRSVRQPVLGRSDVRGKRSDVGYPIPVWNTKLFDGGMMDADTHTVYRNTSDGGMSSAEGDVDTKGRSSRPTFVLPNRYRIRSP